MSLTKYEQRGEIIDYTPGADSKSGEIVVLGELVGQVVTDAKAGELVGLRIEGAIRAPKLSTDVVTIGAVLYWDPSTDELTLTKGVLSQAGWALENAGNGVANVLVKLGR